MDIKNKIRIIENFPIDGISFKDITTLLQDKKALQVAIDGLCSLIDGDVDIVASPEARGFIFGTALAYKLNAGFVPIRKPGKLPADTIKYTYELEYGADELEIHTDAIKKGDKVVIVDDLLATGGTLFSCAKLVEGLGGEVTNIITLIELTEIGGREKLADYKTKALIAYEY
ncbi:MAG: adenine phosphoribosyltransferase [Anaerofustis sp.]